VNRSSPDEVSEIRARLLRAGRSERPSRRLMPRTLAAVGAGAAGTLGAAKASALGGVAAYALAWKWVGVGVLGGIAVVGGWHGVSTREPMAPMAVEMASVPSEQTEIAPRAAMVLPMASAPLPPMVDIRERDAPKPSRAPVPAPVASASSPASGLSEEIAALEQARRALAAGDSDAAMVTLDHHERQFPSSQLDHEAAVLRVEALIAARRCGVARAEATAFLQDHPRSPAARRMESLMAVGCAE
jgi:hypothetical protein